MINLYSDYVKCLIELKLLEAYKDRIPGHPFWGRVMLWSECLLQTQLNCYACLAGTLEAGTKCTLSTMTLASRSIFHLVKPNAEPVCLNQLCRTLNSPRDNLIKLAKSLGTFCLFYLFSPLFLLLEDDKEGLMNRHSECCKNIRFHEGKPTSWTLEMKSSS
jgi:hypothetical protein